MTWVSIILPTSIQRLLCSAFWWSSNPYPQLFGSSEPFKVLEDDPTLSTLPLECEPCQLEKQTDVIFPKCLNKQVTSHLELVHSGLFGPNCTQSTLGFSFFVIFIDDFSRCSLCFNFLFAEMEIQFNVTMYTVYCTKWQCKRIFIHILRFLYDTLTDPLLVIMCIQFNKMESWMIKPPPYGGN